MSIKKKFITGWIVIAALAGAMLITGLFKKETMFFDMGIAMLFVGIARVIRDTRLLKNKEKVKEFEIMQKDERNMYIAQKSYAWTFWIAILGEYTAFLVCAFMNLMAWALETRSQCALCLKN